MSLSSEKKITNKYLVVLKVIIKDLKQLKMSTTPASKFTQLLKTPATKGSPADQAEEPTVAEIQKSIARAKEQARALAEKYAKDKIRVFGLNLEVKDDQQQLNKAREFLQEVTDELQTSNLELFIKDSPADLCDNTANSTDKGLHSTLFRAITSCINRA